MYYDLKTIQSHKTINDCWIVAGNRVYDITKFLKIHPNHIKRIFSKINENAIEDYNFHTKNQKNIWEKYFIGYVLEEELQTCYIL